MVSAHAASFADLFLAVTALGLFSFLDLQTGAGTATPVLLDGAAEVWLPAATAGAFTLFVATVAFMYHQLSRAGVPGAGAAIRRISGLVISVLCASVGTLEYVLFGQAAGGAQARALGLAALRALPAAATAAFFLGMMLIVVAHVRAGGEGGGGASAGVGPVQGPVRVLTNVAFGAAAALVLLMAMAAIHGAK